MERDKYIEQPIPRYNEPSENEITDGFGTFWLKKCEKCGMNTMCVERPGMAKCSNCGE